MSTVLPSQQEVKQAVENVGILVRWGRWFKGLFKRKANTAMLLIAAVLAGGCSTSQLAGVGAGLGAGAGLIKLIGSIKLPPPPDARPTPRPEPTSTPIPTATPTPTHPGFPKNPCDPQNFSDCDCYQYVRPNWMYKECGDPTPEPTEEPTPEPTPGANPVVAFWKVGGLHQPIEQHRCQNPADGHKFMNQDICIIGSTTYLAGPENPRDSGPCDPDHGHYWFGICHQREWDDPRGPLVTVRGAEDLGQDPENSYYEVVRFNRGQPFTICMRPRPDYMTRDGIHLANVDSGETCTEHKY